MEAVVVSGYDKKSPNPKYEPNLGRNGNIFLISLVVFILIASFGGIFL